MRAYRFKTGGYIADEIVLKGRSKSHYRAIFSDAGDLLDCESHPPGNLVDARDSGIEADRAIAAMFPAVVEAAKLCPQVDDLQGVIASRAHRRR